MRQDKSARVKMESGLGKPAEAKNEDEQMEEAEATDQQTTAAAAKTMKHQALRRRGTFSTVGAAIQCRTPCRHTRNVDVKPEGVQMDQQSEDVSTDKRERSGSLQIEQPAPVEFLEKHKRQLLQHNTKATTLEWLMTS